VSRHSMDWIFQLRPIAPPGHAAPPRRAGPRSPRACSFPVSQMRRRLHAQRKGASNRNGARPPLRARRRTLSRSAPDPRLQGRTDRSEAVQRRQHVGQPVGMLDHGQPPRGFSRARATAIQFASGVSSRKDASLPMSCAQCPHRRANRADWRSRGRRTSAANRPEARDIGLHDVQRQAASSALRRASAA
jgi:hypothetical protein